MGVIFSQFFGLLVVTCVSFHRHSFFSLFYQKHCFICSVSPDERGLTTFCLSQTDIVQWHLDIIKKTSTGIKSRTEKLREASLSKRNTMVRLLICRHLSYFD